jgi:hypothetical protein
MEAAMGGDESRIGEIKNVYNFMVRPLERN